MSEATETEGSPRSSSAKAQSCGYPVQGNLLGLPSRDGEEWVRIDGFPTYWVSTHGRVYSEPTRWKRNGGSRGGIMTGTDQGGGYEQVLLKHDGETKGATVHRLVIENLGPEPPAEQHSVVNHIDGNKTNNHIDNLEWVTDLENRLHGALLQSLRKHGRGEVMQKIDTWIEAETG